MGDPLPPFVSIPEIAGDFAVEQVGYGLLFSWTNPSRNVDQSASIDLDRALIRENETVVSDLAVSGPGERQLETLDAMELVGSTREYTISFETLSQRVSARSSPVRVTVIEVPDPGTGVRATVDQNRILLEWDPPESGAQITDGYRVYRSDEIITGDAPLSARRFEDTGYLEGATYTYTVLPLRLGGSGLVISGLPYDPLSVTALDVTPPEPPTGLSLTPFAGGVFVRWQFNPEIDVVRYNVFRRDNPGGEFRSVGPPEQATNAFQDPEYQPGFVYSVTALDRSGNESERSISIGE